MPVVESTVQLPCDAQKAYEQWLQVVWVQGGGMGAVTVENKGDANHVGHLRRVAMGIREKILETQPGRKIVYTVVSGPIPLKEHLGEVFFEEAANKASTEVKWRCTYTPYWGVGWAMGYTISFAFSRMLATLKSSVSKAS